MIPHLAHLTRGVGHVLGTQNDHRYNIGMPSICGGHVSGTRNDHRYNIGMPSVCGGHVLGTRNDHRYNIGMPSVGRGVSINSHSKFNSSHFSTQRGIDVRFLV